MKELFQYIIDNQPKVKISLKVKLLLGFSITKRDLNHRGGLFLEYSNISSLPNNLRIYHSLNISNTKITSLPDNLRVDGYLLLFNTEINTLPDDLIVGEHIYVNDNRVTEFKIKFPKYAKQII